MYLTQLKKDNYEFLNLSLWWFKVPEVAATLGMIVGIIVFLLGAGPQLFFWGFWMRLLMVPIRISFVKQKRSLEAEFPILKRKVYASADAYQTLHLAYLRTEKRAADWLDRVYKKLGK